MTQLGTAYPPLSAISRLQLDPMAISKSPYPGERVDDSPIWRSAGDCALNRVQAQHDSIETENPPLSAIFGLQLDPMEISRSPNSTSIRLSYPSPIWARNSVVSPEFRKFPAKNYLSHE